MVFLVIFLAAESFGAFKHWRDINPAYNSITVSGKGEAFAVPDLATFSFSVSADAKTVAEAQSQVTSKIDTIVSKLKDLGIEEKDVKTIDYNVYPKYTYSSSPCSPTYCPPSKQTQDGYTASHSISVKVRKTEDAGTALALAGDAGATNLSGISFTVDDLEKITAEARAMAIKDAKEKAKSLSDELDVNLVRVVSYSDGTEGVGPMPYYSERSSTGVMAVDQAKAPTLPTGENKVSIVVNVTYEIR